MFSAWVSSYRISLFFCPPPGPPKKSRGFQLGRPAGKEKKRRSNLGNWAGGMPKSSSHGKSGLVIHSVCEACDLWAWPTRKGT